MKCTECRLWKAWMKELDAVIQRDNEKRVEELNQEYLESHPEIA